MVTMQDVAERAGVTKQTVSNVVTGRIPVRPATEARVRAAIEELGYTPNLVARSLATGTTMTVGLFVPTVTSPFYSEIVQEVEDLLERAGYHLLLCTTRLDGERARRQLAGLSSRLVDALLIAGDRDLIDHLPLLADARFPVVLCAWETEAPDTHPVVTIDYERAGYLAGRHLRDLGHERVAVLASLLARRPGGRVPARLRRRRPDDPRQRGLQHPRVVRRRRVRRRRRRARRRPRPDRDLRHPGRPGPGRAGRGDRAGRSVPEDLSVVGHDDIEEVRRSRPPLTTVAIPKREMAQQAIELLLRAVKSGGASTNALHLLRPTLIVRESSGPVRGDSA